MTEQLLAFITDLKSDKGISSFDEAATKQAIILRLLSLLGWNTFDVDQVYPEYSVGTKRVDYSLRIGGVNEVFLEVKKAREELENHQEQLLDYSFREGIRLAVLTNGVTWWFYLPLHAGTWEQRKFYSIDIFQQDPQDIALKFVDFLARENVKSGKAFGNAEAVYKSQQRQKILQETLPKAWNMIISEPDELLVDLVNETSERICGYKADDGTIERFLSTYRNQLLIPADASIESVLSTPPTQRQIAETRARTSISKETRKDSLLKLIYNIGGEGTRSQINKRIPDYWELRPEEWEIKEGTRKPLYWHHVASACQALKGKYGYLDNPKRGIWRLTDKGRNYLDSMPLVPRKKVVSPPIPEALPPTLTSISEDYTSKKISSFYFKGTRYEVSTWRELLFTLCSVMSTMHGDDFDEVLELKGRKRRYFMRDESQLTYPKRIPNTDIFVELNLSARNTTQVCRSLIALFGYSDDDLKVELKAE